MIDILTQLAHGFVNCLTPLNMAMPYRHRHRLAHRRVARPDAGYGRRPGLPFTYKMDVTASIILLTAMYVSGTYGGAFTAILFRIPGEPIDVPMLWDGYTMGRKRQAGQGAGLDPGCCAVRRSLSAVVMVALTQPLAKFALRSRRLNIS